MNSNFCRWSMSGLLACSMFYGYTQQINPMTEAVMRNYAEILAENPKDYLTLYDRASQYYNMGEYSRALSDIEMALDYTPESESTYRQAEYSLKSDILMAQKNILAAIEASKAALVINPVSQPDLYKIGNLYLVNNAPQDALNAFQSLQRENPRSQEAFYGMAKANAMMGNNAEVESLIKEIESLGKQSYITYCRLGDLYSDMGNVKEATTNYAIAYTLEDNSSRPIESLKVLARKSPTEVMDVIDGISNSSQDNISLLYLMAMVAFDGGMFDKAEQACARLASELEEESPAVYRMLAMAQLAQNKVSEAGANIDKAEILAPSDPGVLLDKAEIIMSANPQSAYENAARAHQIMPEDEGTLLTVAKAAIMAGKYLEAREYLNSLILSNPGNAEALLIRGYLNTEFLNDGKAGVADYTRAGNIGQSGNVANQVYAALGKAKINKKLDADGIIKDAIVKAGNNKNDLYLIAVYYAQTGNLEEAKAFVDKALLNGYNNIYNLRTNNQPLLNLSPIHHLFK